MEAEKGLNFIEIMEEDSGQVNSILTCFLRTEWILLRPCQEPCVFALVEKHGGKQIFAMTTPTSNEDGNTDAIKKTLNGWPRI